MASDFEKERRQQNSYLKSMAGSYLPYGEYTKQLDEYLMSAKPEIVVRSMPGMGKSSFLAYWIANRRKNKDEKIVYHFIGESDSGADYLEITKRLVYEITFLFELDTEDFNASKITDKNKIHDCPFKEKFQKCMGDIPQNQKLVIVLDGLNRLDEGNYSKRLLWIPKLPQNVKIIYSTRYGDKSNETLLRYFEHKLPALEIENFPEDIRKELIAMYSEKNSIILSDEQISRIISDKKTETPSLLIGILDNLKIFAVPDTYDSRIEEILSQKTNENLYDYFLQNIEAAFIAGKINPAKDIFYLIGVSKRGLAEADLFNILRDVLTSCDSKQAFKKINDSMCGLLLATNGRVTFSNNYIFNAVKKRYLKNNKKTQKYQKTLAEYMEKNEDVSFEWKCEEYPFQLLNLEEWDKLYNFLLDYKTFICIYSKDKYELHTYWRALLDCDAERYSFKKYLEINIEDKKKLLIFYDCISSFINELLHDDDLNCVFSKKYEEIFIKHSKYEETDFGKIIIGNCKMAAFDYNKAINYYNNVLADREKYNDSKSSLDAECFKNIGNCYLKLAEYDKAIEYLKKSIEIFENDYANYQPGIAKAGYLSALCYESLGDFNKAKDFCGKSYGIWFDLYKDDDHPNIIEINYHRAQCYFNLGDYKSALEYYEKLADLLPKVYGKEHLYTANSIKYLDECNKKIEESENEPDSDEEESPPPDEDKLNENRQIRIFISSTFRDMMDERDYLVTRVFPELRRYCDDRDISLFELDLRWGVTQEESENQMAFKICLNEVDNTRPFFIGLLGERYGWVPDDKTIEQMRPTNVFDEYEWLMDELKKKKSITEVEFQEGVFIPQENEEINAYFYIRSPKMNTPAEFREEKGSHGEKMLLELKEKIKNDPKYEFNEYESIEQLGQQVEEDFKTLVDKLFPGQGHLSDFEKERQQQYVYLKSKTRTYAADPDEYKRLQHSVSDTAAPDFATYVYGKSGAGKSAFLANWIFYRQKKRFRNEKIIYHFIGVSQSGGDHLKIMQRLIDEVSSLYDLKLTEDEITSLGSDNKQDELRGIFQKLLFAIPEKQKLIIILESLDRLDDRDDSKLLFWFPKYPGNVKVIVSTTTGDKSMSAKERFSLNETEITPLSFKKREEIIKKYFAKFSKKLTASQIKNIITKKKCENPAVLIALLDNLRIFGIFDIFDKQIEERLSLNSSESLFDLFLQNIESVFSDEIKNKVRDILSLLTLSRRGLTEHEIINISKIPILYWSQLSNCMSVHLLTINGLVAFAGSIMPKAVKSRYLKDSEAEQPYREKIRAYMEAEDNVSFSRRCDELPLQLLELKEWDRLYNFLLDYNAFIYLYKKDRYELGKYWMALRKKDANRYTMEKFLSYKSEDRDELLYFYSSITSFLINILSDYNPALAFALKYEELCMQYLGNEHKETTTAYILLGICYNENNNYSKAQEYFAKALACRIKMYGEKHTLTAESKRYLSLSYLKCGEYQTAITYCEEVLKIYNDLDEKDNSDTVKLDSLLAYCYNSIGLFQTAINIEDDNYDTKLWLYGEEHPETAESLNNLGIYNYNIGEYGAAFGYHMDAHNILVNIYGKEHPSIAASYIYLAKCSVEYSDDKNTLNYCKKALGIIKKFNEQETSDSADVYMVIGKHYEYNDDYCKALEQYNLAYEINKKILGEEHPSTVRIITKIGVCHLFMEEFEKALEYLLEAKNIYNGYYTEKHPDIAENEQQIGLCYEFLEKYDDAVKYYRDSIRIHESIFKDNNPQPQWYYNAALCYDSMEDYDNAAAFYEKALFIYSKDEEKYEKKIAQVKEDLDKLISKNLLDDIDEENDAEIYNEQNDIAFSDYNTASDYFSQEDYENAVIYYIKALDVFKEINGEEHLDTANTCFNAANCYELSEDFEKALSYYTETLGMYEKIHEEENADTAFVYYSMASCYAGLNDNQKALEYDEKALAIREKILGKEHEDTALSYNNTGTDYRFLGNYEKALFYHQTGLEIRKSLFGDNSDMAAFSYHVIAKDYIAMGDDKNALKFYKLALNIYESLEGYEDKIEEANEAIKKLSGEK